MTDANVQRIILLNAQDKPGVCEVYSGGFLVPLFDQYIRAIIHIRTTLDYPLWTPL